MSKKKKNEAWGENGFEDWGGYMEAKKAKLEEQFQNEANKEFQDASNLFEGISIFVNGYTDPSADELRRLMMAHGGVYHHYMRPRLTTHIIASNLPYSKITMYRKSKNPLPLCKPQWITDSIKANKVLNFQNYLLYSNCTDVQPQLQYVVNNKKNETNVNLDGHNKTRTDNELNILEDNCDKTVKITKDVTINAGSSDPVKTVNAKAARSTKDTEFLSEFYNHSRLHYIATMGATFKEYVNELRDKSTGQFPGLARLKEYKDSKLVRSLADSELSFNDEILDPDDCKEINQDPVIMHIDMDCFFVSVGLRDKPELKGLPVAVTHAKGKKTSNEVLGPNDDERGSLSEVASCSYEARKAGVKNGMFLGEALKLCPNLKTIPYDFEGYKEVSYTLYDTVASYTLDIEAVSCDEMYADCTKILKKSCVTPLEFATIIREEIKHKTGCPVSTGFGNSKLLARLATRKAKPDGQFYIKKEQIAMCIAPLNVRDLPGVGGTTAYKLNSINVHTCAELQEVSLSVLQKEFGKKTGEILYNVCRGIDHSKLNVEHVRKSVSAEVNYGIRFESNDDAIGFLKKLSVEVCSRLKKANAKGRCITLKLMVRSKDAPEEAEKFMGHGLCEYMTRSKNLIAPINDADIITKEVLALWSQLQQLPKDARGIGIQISRLDVSKHKSRDVSLASFVSKMKQSDLTHQSTGSNNHNEIQLPRNSEAGPSSTAKDLKGFFSKQPASIKSKSSETCKVLESTVFPVNAEVTDKQNIHIPSDMNESVLAELPEDIRNEILGTIGKNTLDSTSSKAEVKSTTVAKSNEKKSDKTVQTHQENFFKHTKPSSGKSGKVDMPALQEIDMTVLIELPEDIRNEILNEYSAQKNQNASSTDTTEIRTSANSCTSMTNNAVCTAIRETEQDISFSQVDPEFLAALSEDLRRDVQAYCAVKKSERSSVIKKNEEAPHSSKLPKGANMLKPSKRIERAGKVKSVRNAKSGSTKNTNKKKGTQAVFKNMENKTAFEESKKGNNVNITSIKDFDRGAKTINSKVTAEEAEAIRSHNRTIVDNIESVNEHEENLINLVNHLFNLPLEQVKMQIQTWIIKAKVVNEVDFLSLATFLSMLPEKKRIEDLHVLLKTMHRCMTKTGNCIWHRAYRKTVKHVQHYMQIEYNSNLMVPPIRCNLLQCNSDVM